MATFITMQREHTGSVGLVCAVQLCMGYVTYEAWAPTAVAHNGYYLRWLDLLPLSIK